MLPSAVIVAANRLPDPRTGLLLPGAAQLLRDGVYIAKSLFDAATGSSVRLATPSGGHSNANGRAPSGRVPSQGAAGVASQALAAASAVGEAGATRAAPWLHAAARPRLRGTPPALLCDQAFTPPLASLSDARRIYPTL